MEGGRTMIKRRGGAMIKRLVILAIVAGLVFPFPVFSAVVGEFAVVTGDVTVTRAGKATKPKVKDSVQTIDLISTGRNSNARIALTDESNMAIGPNTRLEVKRFVAQGGRTTGLFYVPTGLVQTKIAKALGPGSRFEIQTPTAIAGVRGTAWLTLVEPAAQGSATSSFYTLEQSIAVSNPALTAPGVAVPAGNFSVVAAGVAPTTAAAFDAAVVAGLTSQLGAAAIPGVAAGAAGAGTAGAAGAGTSAGAATVAGVGVGTIAIAAVAAAIIVAAIVASSSKSDDTPAATAHHH
jgi:hypothetical protein